jgi:hypothetical protein
MAPPLNPFEFIQRKGEPSGGTVTQPATTVAESEAPGVKTPRQGDVDELKRRVQELESLVSTLTPKKTPKQRK